MSLPDPQSPAARAARVATLLDLVWRGQQGRMAADLAINKSTVSRVAAGKAHPGRKLLAALALHPRVDPAWLYTGVGEPPSGAPVEPPPLPPTLTLRIEVVVLGGLPAGVTLAPAAVEVPLPLVLSRPSPPFPPFPSSSPAATPPAERGGRS